jgi:hypothetical protein
MGLREDGKRSGYREGVTLYYSERLFPACHFAAGCSRSPQMITLVPPRIKGIGKVADVDRRYVGRIETSGILRKELESPTSRSKSVSGSGSGPGSDLRHITRSGGAAGGNVVLGLVCRGVELRCCDDCRGCPRLQEEERCSDVMHHRRHRQS